MADIHQVTLAGRSPLLIKLRPGLAEFLRRAHHLFELTIYTHGSREYAWKVMKIIDPKVR